jgi:hypothetical protein
MADDAVAHPLNAFGLFARGAEATMRKPGLSQCCDPLQRKALTQLASRRVSDDEMI